MDLILEYVKTNRTDILLMQEPYTRNGLLPGFEVQPFRTLLSKGEVRRDSHHRIHGSAIIVCNPSLRVLFREDLTTELFTVMTTN